MVVFNSLDAGLRHDASDTERTTNPIRKTKRGQPSPATSHEPCPSTSWGKTLYNTWKQATVCNPCGPFRFSSFARRLERNFVFCPLSTRREGQAVLGYQSWIFLSSVPYLVSVLVRSPMMSSFLARSNISIELKGSTCHQKNVVIVLEKYLISKKGVNSKIPIEKQARTTPPPNCRHAQSPQPTNKFPTPYVKGMERTPEEAWSRSVPQRPSYCAHSKITQHTSSSQIRAVSPVWIITFSRRVFGSEGRFLCSRKTKRKMSHLRLGVLALKRPGGGLLTLELFCESF